MARLLNDPGLGIIQQSFLSGPRTVGSGQSSTIGNFTQTFSSPYGLWSFECGFQPLHRQEGRRLKGWATALHGGANASRWEFRDPDIPQPSELGITTTMKAWGNGENWSNGCAWASGLPPVRVSSDASDGGTVVALTGEHWGDSLYEGTFIGFFPFHLGIYAITEYLGYGEYRIWPPLRKSISSEDYATLTPTMAVRVVSQDGIEIPRDGYLTQGAKSMLLEVLDYDVRDYFTESNTSIRT